MNLRLNSLKIGPAALVIAVTLAPCSPVQAVVVDNTTAGAAIVGVNGNTAEMIFPFDFLPPFIVATPGAGDIQPDTASAMAAITGIDGKAEATVLGDVKSEVNVSDDGTGAAGANTLGVGVGAWVATLTSDGSDPGGEVDVDLTVHLDGRLKYGDALGDAATVEIPDPFDASATFDVSDISASVSLLIALAPALGPVSEDVLMMDPLPVIPVFNGSANLRSPKAGEVGPILDIVEDFSLATFTSGDCGDGDASTECVDVLLDFLIPDAAMFGFGEAFELGVVLLTAGDILGGTGVRSASSLFFGTATVTPSTNAPGVNIVLLSQAVPEPETLFLLAFGLAGLGFARRKYPLSRK